VQFQQLTRKLYRDPIAIYGADGVDMVLQKSKATRDMPESLLCKRRIRSPKLKDSQLRPPRCKVTAIRRIDRNISAVPHLAPLNSNLSKPSLIPLFLSPRSLDVYGTSGSWVPSPNARTKRPAIDRNAGNQKSKNFGTQIIGYFGMLTSDQKLYSTFYFRCTLPIQ
jgi:hypothetical protein